LFSTTWQVWSLSLPLKLTVPLVAALAVFTRDIAVMTTGFKNKLFIDIPFDLTLSIS
jgi:hypothetical protein